MNITEPVERIFETNFHCKPDKPIMNKEPQDCCENARMPQITSAIEELAREIDISRDVDAQLIDRIDDVLRPVSEGECEGKEMCEGGVCSLAEKLNSLSRYVRKSRENKQRVLDRIEL